MTEYSWIGYTLRKICMKVTAYASSSLSLISVHPHSYRTTGDEKIGNFGHTALVFPIVVSHSHFWVMQNSCLVQYLRPEMTKTSCIWAKLIPSLSGQNWRWDFKGLTIRSPSPHRHRVLIPLTQSSLCQGHTEHLACVSWIFSFPPWHKALP